MCIEGHRRQAITPEDEDFHLGIPFPMPSVPEHAQFDHHSEGRALPCRSSLLVRLLQGCSHTFLNGRRRTHHQLLVAVWLMVACPRVLSGSPLFSLLLPPLPFLVCPLEFCLVTVQTDKLVWVGNYKSFCPRMLVMSVGVVLLSGLTASRQPWLGELGTC